MPIKIKRPTRITANQRVTAKKVLAYDPSYLFANGEVGAWYDPSDLSTMFQDAAGTVPVTGVEQPVGLILDKSKGLTLGGTELVTNGNFTNGTTGWSFQENATGSIVGGELRVTLSNSFNRGTTQNISTVTGRTYNVTAVLRTATGQLALTSLNGGTILSTTTVNATGSDQALSIQFIAASTTTTIIFNQVAAGSTETYYAKSVSVKELYAGNHASQSTTARRPVLSARYNLLTRTEQFDDAVWFKVRSSATNTTATTDPLGGNTAEKLTEDTQTGAHYVSNLSGALTVQSTSYIWSCYIKAAERGFAVLGTGVLGGETGLTAAGICIDLSNGNVTATNGTFSVSSVTAAGNGWWRASITVLGTAGNGRFWVAMTQNGTSADVTAIGYTGNNTSGIYIWGADLRVANEGSNLPVYQRVGAATAGSSTSAGTADYDTVGFPPYLRFDGTDDALQTSNIDFTATDKVTLFAGVRKLSDTFGVIAEFSPSSASNNNSFHLGSDTIYGFFSRGTTRTDATVTALSPRTDTLTGIGNVSGDNTILRLNGIQADIDAGDQGTGTYGNYPLFIGARGGTANRFNGRLYSLIVRGAATDTLNLLNTERWVSGKTGLPYTNNIENTVAREIFDRADGVIFDRQDSVITRRT